MRRVFVVSLSVAVLALVPHPLFAQVLGAFRWQQTPYCNLVTLTVTAAGGTFQLDGFDDNCGAGTRSAVSGIAFPNPNGSVGAGLTMVTAPGAAPLHLDVTLSATSFNGSWRDNGGNTGVWVFTQGPTGTGGSPRPLPRPLFTAGLSMGGASVSNVAQPVAPGDATPKAYVDGGLSAVRAYANGLATSPITVTSYTAATATGRLFPIGIGCSQLDSSQTTLAFVDLPLPLGAVIQGMRLRYIDVSSAAMSFKVVSTELDDGNFTVVDASPTFASSNGTNGFRVETVTFTSTPVAVGRFKILQISAPVHDGASMFFCGADVLFAVP